MMTKRHLVMLGFMVLALGVSFTAGWAGNSAACDPADCATACRVMTAEECAAVCPPECIVLCDEPCAKSASTDCAPGCGPGNCAMVSKAGGTLTALDPSGQMTLLLGAGQGAEISK